MQDDRIAGGTIAAPFATPSFPSVLERAGDRHPESELTVEAYARLWIEEYRGRTDRGIDESTRHDYRRSLELHALPAIGAVALSDLTPRDVRALILTLERAGQAPGSVRKHLAPVRAML